MTTKLTQTVQKGGCAAKVAASELRKILGQVQFPPQGKNILVDGSLFDDAAIDLIRPDLALVQTLDFFTPIVDSAKIFGEIAAANALSDIFAMGAQPRTALAILAFPLATMESSVIVDVLQGASDKIKESGAAFVGGHSIDDDTLKFGLSVTGEVHPEKIWKNSGARVGDHLILTKPLGTGTATAALKRQVVSEAEITDELASMCRLNQILPLLTEGLGAGVHAATDITGFGLCGHAYQMAQASRVSFSLKTKDIPHFSKTLSWLAEGYLTKAHRTNLEYVESKTQFRFADEILKKLLVDPQTSGGLLLSVQPSLSASIQKALNAHFPGVQIIGEVREATDHELLFE